MQTCVPGPVQQAQERQLLDARCEIELEENMFSQHKGTGTAPLSMHRNHVIAEK